MKRDSFTQELDLGRELLIDNFAGGGGTSTGMEAAFGRPVDIAINHDPEALAMHALNHPHTHHLCESVWEVNPIEVTRNQPVGLVWLSPDCFPAGTLVMTREGYTPIEEIQIGDEVLTHQSRWRKVTETSSARRPLISIKGHGHPGIAVSPEHPFLARLRKDIWDTEPPGDRRTLEPQDWVPASALDKGWYWATPTSFPGANIPSIDGHSMEADESDERLLWLAGRYLGDGWTRLTETRADVVITCGMHEVERLRDKLNQWPREASRSEFNELEWHERATGAAYQFTTDHRGLVQWLGTHFGHSAESKRMPAWVLGASEDCRRALLAGYLSADDWDNVTFSECRTVSKALAFGVKALLTSLGETVMVHKLANSPVIEGHQVNAREIYMLRWRAQIAEKHAQTFRENGMEWCPIREQKDLACDAEVFNIGVDEDESYVVEGIVVHNCKHFSKAKGGTPVAKHIRGLAWVALRWAATTKPRIIAIENVEEFLTWGPLLLDDEGNYKPDPAKRGKIFQSFVWQLRKHGYKVEWKVMRACDNGAPTIRKRFFLIARRDGLPICWPAPTYGAPDSTEVISGLLQPWRTAASCIDFELESTSIFERKKSLVDNTLRRVAKGLWRHVLTSEKPFIINSSTHANPEGGQVLTPFINEYANSSSQHTMPADEPLRTVCAQVKGGHFSMVAPTLVPMRGTSEAHLNNAHSVDQPLSTISAGGTHHALVAGHITKFNTGSVGYSLDQPIATITAGGTPKRPSTGITQGLVGAHLVTVGYGERKRQEARTQELSNPLGTVVAGGVKSALVAAHLVDMGHGESSKTGAKRWSHGIRDIETPLNTITASGGTSALTQAYLMPSTIPAETLQTAFMEQANGGFYDGDGRSLDQPVSTITSAGSNQRLITAYCVKYYSSGGQWQGLGEPMHTIPTKGRLGLVQAIQVPRDCVAPNMLKRARKCAALLRKHLPEHFPKKFDLLIMGEYLLVDITLRMLKPKELYRAQSFPSTYLINEIPDPALLFVNGQQVPGDPRLLPRIRLSGEAQVRMCGNSVAPLQAEALIRANFRHEDLIYGKMAA